LRPGKPGPGKPGPGKPGPGSLRLGKHVTLSESEGGAVLLDLRSGRYWQLNTTGVLVLQTLLDGGDEERAVAAVAARYPVDPDRAHADVRSLVTALRDARLVTVEGRES
jgi:hypothetical protein